MFLKNIANNGYEVGLTLCEQGGQRTAGTDDGEYHAPDECQNMVSAFVQAQQPLSADSGISWVGSSETTPSKASITEERRRGRRILNFGEHRISMVQSHTEYRDRVSRYRKGLARVES